MKGARLVVYLLALLLIGVLIGCGGSSNSNPSSNNGTPLTVLTTSSQLPAGVVNTAYAGASLTASGGTSPYTWSISGGALPAGLTLSASGAIAGTPTASGTASFTAKVTDSSSPQKSATANLSITVNPAALTITTNSLAAGTMGSAYSATVAASGGVQPYTWSITSGSLPTGLSIDPNAGTISGTPTATGTFNFTVTATDSESPAATANASLSIVINAAGACPNNSNFHASYAMLLQGWTGTGASEFFYGAAASFVADGAGNISSGLIDTNDASNGPQSGSFTGTYCVASNNLGTMSLTTSLGNIALAFSLESNGNGHIIVYDTGTVQAAGTLLKQTTSAFSTSSISGNYATIMLGVDPSTGNRLGVAGAFTANGTANLTSGELDINEQGTPTNTTFSASNLTVAATGRGTVGVDITGLGTLDCVFYVVSSSQILFVSSDSGGFALLTGQISKQSSALTGTLADLNGVSVLSTEGLQGGTTPEVNVAIVTADGAGSITASGTQDLGGTPTTFSPASASYAVAANGRVAVTSGGNTIAIAYLTAKNNAFVIDTSDAVGYGNLVPQTGGPFSNSLLSGNYYGGSRQPELPSVSEEVDQLNASTGTFNIMIESDVTQGNGSGNPSTNSSSGTYTVASDGSGTVSESGNQIGLIYMVTPSNFLFLDTTTSNPKLVGFQH